MWSNVYNEHNRSNTKFRQAAEICFIGEVQIQSLAISSSRIPSFLAMLSVSGFGHYLYQLGRNSPTLRDHRQHHQHRQHPFTTENFDRKINNCDLYHCLRPLIITARLFGIFPIQGIFFNNSKKLENLKFKWTSISTIISALICCSLFILSGAGFLNFFNDSELAHDGKTEGTKRIIFGTRDPILSGVGAILYTIFLTKSPALLKLFKIWRKSSESLRLKGRHPSLFKHINVVGFTILIPGLIHSTLLFLSRFGIFDGNNNRDSEDTVFPNITRLKSYYSGYGLNWDGLSEYNGIFSCFLFVILNLATFSILFCDVLIISMSILLYKKFDGLITQARNHLSYYKRKSNNRLLIFQKISIESIARDHLWPQVRRDHLISMHLVWVADEILSPFIFISFATSIYFICIQIHQGVTLSCNHGSYTEAILSGLQLTTLITRMILVSLMAARVHDKGQEISDCVQKCPNELYSTELERLERMLSHSNLIGLSGLGGCFIVNKALLLVIGSVIFTVEIVLFQASASSLRVESNNITETVLNNCTLL